MTRIKNERKTQRLTLFMNEITVGSLERKQNGVLSFAYAQSWLERQQPIPISHQFPLRERSYTGQAVAHYFDNLLPDDRRIREQIAASTQAGGTQSFDLLAAIGRDCIGALQFYSESELPKFDSTLQGEIITETQIAAVLKNLRIHPLGIHNKQDFRISLAGVQPKTALLRLDHQWLLPKRATPTTHILKPAMGHIPEGPDFSLSVENEWLCLRLLHAYGLKVAHADLVEFDGIKTLVIERFDRSWSGQKLYRLPQEDLCQALGLGPEMKYESDGGPGMRDILKLLQESNQRGQDQHHFIKAQLIFWMIAAIDGHAKNFSLFLQPNGFSLTPFYDVISAEPHINPKTLPSQKIKLAMSVGNRRHTKIQEIALRHWQQTAALCKWNGLESLIQELVTQTETVINTVSHEIPSGFPASISDPIFKALSLRIKKLL